MTGNGFANLYNATRRDQILSTSIDQIAAPSFCRVSLRRDHY
jgi:hypothetical protein